MNEQKQYPDNGTALEVSEAALNETAPKTRGLGLGDEQDSELDTAEDREMLPRLPLRSGPGKGRRLVRREENPEKVVVTEAQRLLLLDI
jgi:hypothetical protein